MPEDILAGLRAKEEEMEALLNNARREAASIREAALQSARSLKEKLRSELEEELKKTYESRMKETLEEAGRIEEEGRIEAERLREKGEKNLGKVVAEVVSFVKGHHGDRR